MAGKDDRFEFNAPKFVDFTNDNFDTPDDSYFETALETPRAQRKTRRSAVKKGTKTPGDATQNGANKSLAAEPETEVYATPQGKGTKPAEQEQEQTEERVTELAEKIKELPMEGVEKEEQAEQSHVEQMETEEAPTEQLKEEEHVQEEQMKVEQASEEQLKEEKHAKEEEIKTEQVSTEQLKQEQMKSEQLKDEKPLPEQIKTEQLKQEQNTEQLKTEPKHSPEQDLKDSQEAEEEMEHEEQEQEGTEQPSEQPPTATAAQGESVVKKRRVTERLGSVGVRQSPRLAAISKALRRTNASRGSVGGTQASPSHVKKPKAKKTVRRVSGVSGLTEEDKEELATLATFRHKMTTNKKRNSQAPNQPLRPTKPQEFHFATDQRLRKQPTEDPMPAPPPAPRPTRTGTTKPHEFTFATDARLKGKDHGNGDAEEPVEFVRSLRSNSTSNLNKECGGGGGSKGPTIPQPFNLSESRKPHEEPKKFVSMAELNNKFYVQTPERFRTTKRNAISNSTEDVDDAKKPRGCTIPHTPNLTTSRRRRSLSLMTYEEREQEAFKEAQKHTFKAKPVNKKVLQTPPTGYKVEKKLPTVPEPFKITNSKKYQPPLLPEDLTEELGEDANLSMASLPYGGMHLKGKRQTTKIQPFSFDSRDKTKLMMKQEKIKKVLEDEKRLAEFHAQPMPVFEDGVHGVPAKKPPTPTQIKPFNLHVDQRGSAKQEKFKQQLEEEAHADEARRKFHAQSDDVVHKRPFIPEKSTKPLTEISNITLNTEVRASERGEYDLQRKMLEEEMLAAKKMEEERKAAEELVEVARLRRETVHKAQPVPKIKPMIIHPAPHVPTVPKSPNFATDSRLRARSETANTTSNSNSNSTFSL